MGEDVDVVNEQDVDPLQSEPRETRAHRTENTVVAVVEDGAVRRQVDVGPAFHRARVAGLEPPAHLGREDERLPRRGAERLAEATLAEPVPVERRRVEVPDTGLDGRRHRPARRGLANGAEEVAEGRAAEAKLGEEKAGAPEPTRGAV